MKLSIKTIHRNRAGEPTGKVTYSFNHNGEEFTRSTKNKYVSAAVVTFRFKWEDSQFLKNKSLVGTFEDWTKVVFSSQLLTREKAITQARFHQKHVDEESGEKLEATIYTS